MDIKQAIPQLEQIKEELSEMDLTGRTKQQLAKRIRQIEDQIHEYGVGSGYLKRAERVQRDINLALILGTATALVGIAAWTLYKSKDVE